MGWELRTALPQRVSVGRSQGVFQGCRPIWSLEWGGTHFQACVGSSAWFGSSCLMARDHLGCLPHACPTWQLQHNHLGREHGCLFGIWPHKSDFLLILLESVSKKWARGPTHTEGRESYKGMDSRGRGHRGLTWLWHRTITDDIGLMRRARGIWRASQGIHSHLLCDLDPVSPSLGLSYLLL